MSGRGYPATALVAAPPLARGMAGGAWTSRRSVVRIARRPQLRGLLGATGRDAHGHRYAATRPGVGLSFYLSPVDGP
ncbi:hypothetical protein SEA_LADYBIRD_34 [Mycobacterium phage LadyBird]|uniref:hypothetical protein n=1 Tax=Mycobacterium phage LadyBird TaxID=1718166 RepID=UPI0006CE4022|nr:hypothetical protein SEA_LADYBIRD_34 [Mycobacterium phage LadyBird]ALF02175.1 hypothetical protein SEA_LADYBIRD_34 [Mycobacterium phage LadyBird]